jgi:hypothetical protein
VRGEKSRRAALSCGKWQVLRVRYIQILKKFPKFYGRLSSNLRE